jgi:hypothetical protein
MAKNDNAEEEPSIEEILDSIRQIIADDEKGDAGGGPEPSPPPAPVQEQVAFPSTPPSLAPAPVETESGMDEDILDLTQMVEDNPPQRAAAPEKPPFEIELRDIEEPPPPPPLPEPPRVEKVTTVISSSTPADSVPRTDSIFTGHAEAAAMEAFSTLARKTAVEGGGVTIEEIVRTELKPLLRGWLDKHLPHVIERLVREELERVSKRALED